MKYILATMCGLVVLFMGGCAILSLAAGPLAIIPGGIAFFNLAILGALFGWKLQWTPAFYILGVIDILLALSAVLISVSAGIAASDQPYILIAAAVIGLKGLLTFVYARKQSASA